MNKEVVELAQRVASEWSGTDSYNQAATIIKMLTDEIVNWNAMLEAPPTENGEYLCLVEYDFDGRHYRIKKVLSFFNGRWAGLSRDTDMVTYWKELPDNPAGMMCSGCMWPTQYCQCSKSTMQD